MVEMVARPLKDWPGQLRDEDERKPSPFTAKWNQTQDLLDKEAYYLGAETVVLQLAVDERDIRLDGWIRADARPKHPGVTVVLPDSDQGLLSFSTDRYTGPYGPRLDAWQHNVRAIALSMEALRAADRHGTMQGKQYAGFRELGSGIPMGSGTTMTVEEAAAWLADLAMHHSPDMMMGQWHDLVDRMERDAFKYCYRNVARALHPDSGGSEADFAKLQAVKDLLEPHLQ